MFSSKNKESSPKGLKCAFSGRLEIPPAVLQDIVNFSCYSMGISYFFSFLYKFSMLFNGNFAFLQFSMLFNGNMRLRSFGEGGGRKDGQTDGSVSDSETMSQY